MSQIREITAINIDAHWQDWLVDAQSFRYIPKDNPPFTVRREKSKRGDGDYWYGYRKVSGKLHKRYIGKASDLTIEKLESVASLLNVPPESRQNPPITDDASPTTESHHTEEIVRLQAENMQLQNELHEALKKQKA